MFQVKLVLMSVKLELLCMHVHLVARHTCLHAGSPSQGAYGLGLGVAFVKCMHVVCLMYMAPLQQAHASACLYQASSPFCVRGGF